MTKEEARKNHMHLLFSFSLSSWVLDSGASNHMASSKEIFTSLELCNIPTILMGNYTLILQVCGKWTIDLRHENFKMYCVHLLCPSIVFPYIDHPFRYQQVSGVQTWFSIQFINIWWSNSCSWASRSLVQVVYLLQFHSKISFYFTYNTLWWSKHIVELNFWSS